MKKQDDMSKKTYDVFTDTEKLTIKADMVDLDYSADGKINGYNVVSNATVVAWLPPTARIIEREGLLSWDKHGHSICPKKSVT